MNIFDLTVRFFLLKENYIKILYILWHAILYKYFLLVRVISEMPIERRGKFLEILSGEGNLPVLETSIFFK